MKRFILSAMCIALCSIAAIATCNAENKFKPIKSLPKGEKAHRWQQQLKWSADVNKEVFPELQLLGWREVGKFNNQEEIDKLLRDGVDKDRLYGHTIHNKEGKIEGYEILPLSELAEKNAMFKNVTFEAAKSIYGSRISTDDKIVELKWQYKGKEFIEKVAVTEKLNNSRDGLLFSTVGSGLAVNGNDLKMPRPDWLIADEYRSMPEMEFDKYDKIDDNYWKTRFDKIKEKGVTKELKLVSYKEIGIAKDEKQKNKYFFHNISDDAFIMWMEYVKVEGEPRPKVQYNYSTLGEVKKNNPELYDLYLYHAKGAIRLVKLGYDKIVKMTWEYNGKKYNTYAFVSSYVRKPERGAIDNKFLYLVYDNVLITMNATNASIDYRGGGTIARYSTIRSY